MKKARIAAVVAVGLLVSSVALAAGSAADSATGKKHLRRAHQSKVTTVKHDKQVTKSGLRARPHGLTAGHKSAHSLKAATRSGHTAAAKLGHRSHARAGRKVAKVAKTGKAPLPDHR